MRREGGGRNLADAFSARLDAAAGRLSPAALRVIRFIDRNPVTALASSAAELAEKIGTSDATVIRAVQAAGFRGLPDLKRALAATLEQRSTPADNMRRTLADVGKGAEHAVDLVLRTHREGVDALQSEAVRTRITRAISVLHRADRIVVFGVGPSAALAHYLTILLARNGRRARVLDAMGMALADQLLDLRPGDALLVLAYGQPYREVSATFAEARRLNLPIVLVTDSLDRKLARRAEVVVPVQRGRTDRVALHGTTLIALEAVMLGLAAFDRRHAVETLRRLNDLRGTLSGAHDAPIE